MYISDTVFKSWVQGDLTGAEELLTQDAIESSNTLYHAHTLAHRALVRARSKRWETVTAIGDAKASGVSRKPYLTIYYIAKMCRM